MEEETEKIEEIKEIIKRAEEEVIKGVRHWIQGGCDPWLTRVLIEKARRLLELNDEMPYQEWCDLNLRLKKVVEKLKRIE